MLERLALTPTQVLNFQRPLIHILLSDCSPIRIVACEMLWSNFFFRTESSGILNPKPFAVEIYDCSSSTMFASLLLVRGGFIKAALCCIFYMLFFVFILGHNQKWTMELEHVILECFWRRFERIVGFWTKTHIVLVATLVNKKTQGLGFQGKRCCAALSWATVRGRGRWTTAACRKWSCVIDWSFDIRHCNWKL